MFGCLYDLRVEERLLVAIWRGRPAWGVPGVVEAQRRCVVPFPLQDLLQLLFVETGIDEEALFQDLMTT